LEESERQAILLALAHTAVERPGWLGFLRGIALKMDMAQTRKHRQIEALRGDVSAQLFAVVSGQPVIFERFRLMRQAEIGAVLGVDEPTKPFGYRIVFLPPITKMDFPMTTEDHARELIRTGQAGYWELSLRDSISKTPIAHPEQTVIFLEGGWYVVPKIAFEIHPHGRVGNEAMNCDLSEIEVHDEALAERIQDEMRRLGKELPSS
jgi:hypothetical protein